MYALRDRQRLQMSGAGEDFAVIMDGTPVNFSLTVFKYLGVKQDARVLSRCLSRHKFASINTTLSYIEHERYITTASVTKIGSSIDSRTCTTTEAANRQGILQLFCTAA